MHRPVSRVLRSSFFWFVITGLLIFAVDAQVNRARNDIIVDDRVLMRISALWRQQVNREPTRVELGNLAENWIDEELLFREAKRLGLDAQDVIVKRRLIQKMRFIAEEAGVAEPNEATLRDYFEANRQKYELPVRFTFSHIFYRTKPTREQAEQTDASDSNSWRTAGDPTLQRPTYTRQSARRIASEFGTGFADAISQLAASDEWQGPVASEFGWHLVRIESVEERTVPGFRAVESKVLNDYLFEAREKARRSQLDKLRERYEVIWQVDQEKSD